MYILYDVFHKMFIDTLCYDFCDFYRYNTIKILIHFVRYLSIYFTQLYAILVDVFYTIAIDTFHTIAINKFDTMHYSRRFGTLYTMPIDIVYIVLCYTCQCIPYDNY